MSPLGRREQRCKAVPFLPLSGPHPPASISPSTSLCTLPGVHPSCPSSHSVQNAWTTVTICDDSPLSSDCAPLLPMAPDVIITISPPPQVTTISSFTGLFPHFSCHHPELTPELSVGYVISQHPKPSSLLLLGKHRAISSHNPLTAQHSVSNNWDTHFLPSPHSASSTSLPK